VQLSALQTAIAGNVLASGVLAFAFLYLWLQRREVAAPAFWGAAYLCYCTRQVLILIYAPAGPPLVADLLFIAVPLLILSGTLRFLGRTVPYRLLALAAAVLTLGAMAGYYGLVPRQKIWLPTMLSAAAITLFVTGGLLLRHDRRRPEHVILAVLFVLWGAILSSFPLLLHDMTLRIGYYFANAVALLLVALGLIIASQRQQFLEAQVAREALESANQRFQDVVDTATAWIWEWDAERRIRFISPQVYDSLGIKPEQFIGRRFRDVPGIARLDLTLADADRIFTTARPFRNVPIDVVTDAGKRVRISVTGKPTFDAAGRHTGFRGITLDITETSRLQATLEAVTAAVAGSVGPDYFRLLVERLVRTLGADTAVVGRRIDGGRVATLAAYGDGSHQPDTEYAIAGTPCATTLADGLLIVERDAARLYPEDDILVERGFEGYAGVALRGAEGEVIGLIALLTRAPIPDAELLRAVLAAIAPRAGGELERQIAETALRDSEALLRTLLDSMPVGFYLTDATGRFVQRNRTLESWSGARTGQFLGKTVREAAGDSGAAYAEAEAEIQEVLDTGRMVMREREFRGLTGHSRPALISRFPIFDSGGQIAYVATFINDLTDVRHLEARVREREALFHTVLDHMPVGFHLTDAQGRFVLVNRALDNWAFINRSTVIGHKLSEFAGQVPYDTQTVEAAMRAVVESGRASVDERVDRHADGRERSLLINRYPIFDDSGAVRFVATLLTDVTEMKRLEAEVREREALFRAVIDNMPVAFHLTDGSGRVVQRNRTHDLWGNEIVVGQTFGEMNEISIPEIDRSIVDAEIRDVRETGRTLVRERVDTLKDGTKRPVLVCRFPIFDSTGKVNLVASMVTNVSDLKRLEDQVRQSETRLQRVVAALDRSRKGVVVEDSGNRPIYVNRTASELMGNESSAFAMLERAGIGSEFESHGAWSGEVIHRTRSGNDAVLQASIARLPDGGSVTLLDDATERLERERRQVALERQVQEAQKMDAVGQLAGGIAHDFNNLIGAILGFARFIAEDTDEKTRIHGYAERILSASQRARDLIQQILSFSRRENAPRQPTAITKLVEESAQLLRATVPATLGIEVRNDFPEAWSIVNQTQITQILVNLCLNAADAMAGRPGTLTLALERLPEVDPRLRWLLASDPGSLPRVDAAAAPDQPSRCYVGALRAGSPYLVLSVRDEGSGIPAEILPKIFDPFVTSKPRGQGTGLGLSVVQRLVLAHDGAIVVTTRPGTGTTFDIILPVSGRSSRDIVEAVTRDDETAGPRAALGGAKGRVLVVDDDLHFGDMVSTALDRAGYEVGVCGRPREAIEVFGQRPQRWDVLVTDQTMPEMSGLELIGRLKSLHPGLRCILCTGYASGGLNAASARAGGADAFFHKPVDVDALMTAIVDLVPADPPEKRA